MGIEEGKTLLLVPYVVSGRPDIDGKVIQFFKHRSGDAKASGNVLDIDGHEVHPLAINQTLEFLPEGPAARTAEHISDEKHSNQRAYSTALVSRMTVTLICPGYVSSASTFLAKSRAIHPAFSSEIC